MKHKIRVIIADDHDIYLEGLESRLMSSGDIEVIGSAPNGQKLVELVRQHQPDVVVTDIRMPIMTGTDAIKVIHKINKDIQILVLSTFDNNYLVVDALDAGAIGYILKDAPKAEVVEAVRTVYERTPYYCSRTTTSLARLIKKSKFNPYPVTNQELFTPFEKQIIYYICEEKTSEEISELVHMGKRTIEHYRRKILAIMKVKTSIGIAIYAMKNNLYPVPDILMSR